MQVPNLEGLNPFFASLHNLNYWDARWRLWRNTCDTRGERMIFNFACLLACRARWATNSNNSLGPGCIDTTKHLWHQVDGLVDISGLQGGSAAWKACLQAPPTPSSLNCPLANFLPKCGAWSQATPVRVEKNAFCSGYCCPTEKRPRSKDVIRIVSDSSLCFVRRQDFWNKEMTSIY